jgi:hypothetical protein
MKSRALRRHCRERGNPDLFEIPGFRVAFEPKADQPEAEAIASLPGMTVECCCERLGSDARPTKDLRHKVTI